MPEEQALIGAVPGFAPDRLIAADTVRPGAASAGRWHRGIAAVLAAVSLAISGCTQSSTTGRTGNSPPPTGQHTSAAGQPPNGTQLGSLLKRAQLPAGWQQATGAPPELDSGPNLNLVTGPQSQAHDCGVISYSPAATYFTNWWATSNATLTVQQTQNPGNIVDLTIAAYQPASDAAHTVSYATNLARSCRSFTDSIGSRVTIAAQPAPGVGSQSLYLTSTGQTDAGTIVAQVLLAATGRYLIVVNTDTGTSGPISQATVDQFGTWLAGLAKSAD